MARVKNMRKVRQEGVRTTPHSKLSLLRRKLKLRQASNVEINTERADTSKQEAIQSKVKSSYFTHMLLFLVDVNT